MGDVFLVNGRRRHWQVAEAADIGGLCWGPLFADPHQEAAWSTLPRWY